MIFSVHNTSFEGMDVEHMNFEAEYLADSANLVLTYHPYNTYRENIHDTSAH